MHSLVNFFLRTAFPAAAMGWILLAADLLALATIPSVLASRRGRSLAALSWILALIAIPFGGTVAWWLLGRTHLQRPARKRQRSRRRLDVQHPDPPRRAEDFPAIFREVVPFALEGDRRSTEGVFPPAEATEVRVLAGADAIAAMEAAIDEAETEIRALYYIWKTDDTGRRIADRLALRARQGVTVRVLVDEVGSRPFLRQFAPGLRAAGVEVAGFLPASFRPWAPTFNFRNHRKLLLVDGRYGFAGGMNIGREYERDWRDQCVRLSGPVLANLDEVFQEDWLFATKQGLTDLPQATDGAPAQGRALCAVIASGPDREERRVHDGFLLAVGAARRRIWMTSPYFMPSPSLLDALRAAALRGVDVRVLTPQQSDVRLVAVASRANHESLLRAGVRLFEFLPRFQHTKSLIVDDQLSVVGSVNVDTRSFRLNFELVCFIASRDLNETLAAGFENALLKSREISRADIARRGYFERCCESGANLLSPLL